jgi:dihydrofolate reductase
MIKIIVAASSNLVIGKNNELPWRIPKDLEYFKNMTSACSVLMGRKCWESIPKKFRPLPNRENIVLTRNSEYVADGARVENDLESVIAEFKASGKTLWIIGGAEIYKESFKHADYLHLTRVHGDYEGDTFLERFDESQWKKIYGHLWVGTREENGHRFDFEIYKKNI